MYSVLFLVFFEGFYLWYSTSTRMKIRNNLGTEVWSKNNPLASKIIGSFLLTIGMYTTLELMGIGAGILFSLVLLMTSASCILLLFPLFRVNTIALGGFFLLGILFELSF